jgi:arylsulfatase
VDKRRYPDLVLNPERLEMLRKTGSRTALVHGFKDGSTSNVENIDSIAKMAEGDRLLKEFSVAKIKELARGTALFFLEHAFMKVHADSFASRAFEGKSGSAQGLNIDMTTMRDVGLVPWLFNLYIAPRKKTRSATA